MTLDELHTGQHATISSINWAMLAPDEAKRLRALGLDEGTEVSLAHAGVFGGKDPLAIVVGRMTVAMRRKHASAMTITMEQA